MSTGQLTKTQNIAMKSLLQIRDQAIADINEVLMEAGIVPEMVDHIDLIAGVVYLKNQIEPAEEQAEPIE